ncbi:MAG: hypothetical protein JOZ05_17835 [Acetobacteraceae bacterium]|nr:hypothetical protein [Acetobacteraceae bacterium]
MKAIVVGIALLALLGCAVRPDRDGTMDRYLGLPVSLVMDRIGPPDQERFIAGRRLYGWEISQFISFGQVAGQAMCRIQLTVDPSDIVRGWNIYGSDLGCAAYLRSLHQS